MNMNKKTKACGLCVIGVLVLGEVSLAGEREKSVEPSITITDRLKEERAKVDMPAGNPTRVDLLRVEAARAGDEKERKEIRDQLKDSDALRQEQAIFMAGRVGGSDMVCGLGELLNDTNNFRQIDSINLLHGEGTGKGHCVELVPPPSWAAARMLAQLVETQPAELERFTK